MSINRRPLSSFLFRSNLKAEVRSSNNASAGFPGVFRAVSAQQRERFIDFRALPVAPQSKEKLLRSFVSLEPRTGPVPPQNSPQLSKAHREKSVPQNHSNSGEWIRTGTGTSYFFAQGQAQPLKQVETQKQPALQPQVTPRHVPSVLPALHTTLSGMLSKIKLDFKEQLPKVLSLNRSRREMILQYLENAAGIPSAVRSLGEETSALKSWIHQPGTSQKQQALHALIEEISLATLGQILILKSWSDRDLRTFQLKDLSQLNWVLSQSVERFAPLDRDNWQFLKAGMYSWYHPSTPLCVELFDQLSHFSLLHESPTLLIPLFSHLRPLRADASHWKIWDARFFKRLWGQIESWGFSQKRSKAVFCPTLRDGMIARLAPEGVQWAALESSSFQLLLAELMQLWSGPSAPPLWAQGTGLEVHPREQLSLVSMSQGKATSLSKISDMDAYDLSFVMEDRTLKVSSKNAEAQKLRHLLDGLPYFKKLRDVGTTLGGLQAVVALAKLRPGAHLIWVREERLGLHEGKELLRFLMDRGSLLGEWDFSELQVQVASTEAILPRYVYLWKREIDTPARNANLPRRVKVSGVLNSHVEVETLLTDSLAALEGQLNERRAGYRVMVEASTTPQKEWLEHWPTELDQRTVEEIDRIRMMGTPLATWCTVRAVSQSTPLTKGARAKGMIWVRSEKDSDGRYLHVETVSSRDDAEIPQGSGAFW
jgi:hypothetical protein